MLDLTKMRRPLNNESKPALQKLRHDKEEDVIHIEKMGDGRSSAAKMEPFH